MESGVRVLRILLGPGVAFQGSGLGAGSCRLKKYSKEELQDRVAVALVCEQRQVMVVVLGGARCGCTVSWCLGRT